MSMRQVRVVTVAVVACAALFAGASPAAAQDRVGIGYTLVDDGHCARPASTLAADLLDLGDYQALQEAYKDFLSRGSTSATPSGS